MVKDVIDAMDGYLAHLSKTRGFFIDEMKNFFEPAFIKEGYRNPPKFGEKLYILIIHDAAIGDFVLLSCAIRELRRMYPTAHITLMANAGSLVLGEHCPYVDEIFHNEQRYDPTNFNELYTWNVSFAQNFLQRHYHICYAFIHRPNTAMLAYMSGAQVRVANLSEDVLGTFTLGYDPNKSATPFDGNTLMRSTIDGLMTHLCSMYAYGNHIVDIHLSFVDHILGARTFNREIEIWYSPAELAQAKEFLNPARRPVYALAMGGREKRKHFPPEKYARLVEMILQEDPTATFVVLGAGQDDENSLQTFKENLDEKIFNGHVFSLISRISYRLSAAILTLCDMYIGNDTGIMHVAAAAKCPVLTPNCFAADIARNRADYVRLFSPYHVPSVTIQPAHALDGCKVNFPYVPYGCHEGKAHCILQIETETVFKGYKLLKERIAKKNIEPLFITD